LLDQTLQTLEQQQWLPKFLRYDFTIQYSPGKENIPADALSRSFAMAWSELVNSWLKTVVDATKQDESLLHIYQNCVENAGKFEEYTLYKDVIICKERIMVPNDHTLINTILAEFHASKVGGHAGTTRTSARIIAQFYWPKMREDIRKFIKECVICQQAKVSQSLPAGLLQLIPIPNIIWKEIEMDFITSLPLSRGYSNIMVVIGRLSKFAHFIPLKPGFNSKIVAKAFIQDIVKLYGFPNLIVSDRDKVFISSFWRHLFNSQGIQLAMSSSYHPQSDGQTENLNKILEMYLRCYVFDHPKNWF